MCKIVILGAIQQQAEALSTQYRQVYVLFNDMVYIRNKDEMISSNQIIYINYSAHNTKQEIICLRKLLKKISPDVIYTNGFRQLWMVGFLIRTPGLLPRKPIVLVTSHNSWAWKNASKRFFIALSCHFWADGIFTLATFQENWLQKYGISRQRIRTIPNAVDIEQFNPKGSADYFSGIFSGHKKPPIIVNVANINHTKGQDLLIKCISIVKKEKDNIQLVLMGIQSTDSKYERYLNSLIAENNLEENVFILGNIDHYQIPTVLRSSDISVISSWNEVSPFILLESLAVGKITISTAVGGIPDIIKNEINGFLVQPGDIEGFANCILNVLNNPYLKLSIEKNARISAINNYSYSVIGKKHRDFINSIILQKKCSISN